MDTWSVPPAVGIVGNAGSDATSPVEPGGLPQARGQPVHRGSGTRFSGAPLWRFALRRDEQRRLQEEENQRNGVPEGFARHSDGWYYHPQRRLFWESASQKLFLYNESTQAYAEVHQPISIEKELRLAVDASCIHRHERVRDDRHVIVRDLVKAGQSLRMPIDHLTRPCALLGVYDGHRPTVAGGSGGGGGVAGGGGGGVPAGAAHDTAMATAEPAVPPPGLEDDSPPTCAEFCARNLHLKLLPRLSELKGDWGDRELAAALSASFEDVDAEFLARPGASTDGCSAVVALLTGRQSFVAGLGDAIALLDEESPDDGRRMVSRRTVEHSPAAPSELRRLCAMDQANAVVQASGLRRRAALRASRGEAAGEGEELLQVSRAFGDRAFKAPLRGGGGAGSSRGTWPSLVVATPHVDVSVLHHGHRFLALVCSEIAGVLSDEDIADVLRRKTGRPRVACGALLQAAQDCGAVGSLTALCVFFDWSCQQATQDHASEAKRNSGARDGEEAAVRAPKKPRIDVAVQLGPKQVRCRQILVKCRDSKEPVDRVRSHRPVTRTLAEAERVLREALEAIEGSPEKSIFTQRCKAISECSTCLKGGEMAGDLGWMSRGQAHPAVEAAAFALPVGHVSDIVESDEGVHVLWRIA